MKKRIDRLCIWLGIGLLVCALVTLFCWQFGIHSAEEKMDGYVQRIRALLPAPQGAVLEERSDNTMPVLCLDGTDFVGLLELPSHGSALPVCAEWGEVTRYPCRLGGSVYDRTMQIGGMSQKGQYDFYREISVGDGVYFTDMEGNRFAYEVTDIRYETHADQSALQRSPSALTLFVKNVYAFEYIIIFCNPPH